MEEYPEVEERILVLNGQGPRLGGCFLDTQFKELFLIKEVHAAEKSFEETINSLLMFDPSRIVLSARMNGEVYDILAGKTKDLNYTLEVLGSKSFATDSCNGIIGNLMDVEGGNPSKFYTILSDLHYDKQMGLAKNSLQALKSTIENIQQEHDGDKPFKDFIKNIQIQVSTNHMYIEQDTYYDLQLLKTCNESKKKSCVFDLLNHTGSPIGYKTLSSWFNMPFSNMELINERLDLIECLVSIDNSTYFEDIICSIKNLPNIVHILSSIQSGKSQLSHWQNLSKFLERSLEIHESVSEIAKKYQIPFLIEILEALDPKIIYKLLNRVTKTIDFESSKDWKRVYVRDGFNEQLDGFKVRYNELENVLRDLAYELAVKHTKFSEDSLNLVYIPQLGYLVSLDSKDASNIPQSWEEIFRTTTNVYYKDEISEQMDHDYGDVYQIIIDLEIEILYHLQLKISSFEEPLIKLGSCFGKLDAFCSLAKSTILYNLTRPEFVEDPILIVENGKNIVIEQQVESYISNNTDLSSNQVSIITGANASGKSVYISQIGIISFLAHIGSFVPATYCKIGVMDKILTKKISHESIERNESFFYNDLMKISKALNLKTERSLLLVDEFGRGTDTIGGPSLLGSIVEKLSESNLGTRSVFTTHFHELFKDEVIKSDRITHSHMDVLFSKKLINGSEELTYLYKLKPGLAQDSFGIQCAEICGIPKSIIQKAYKIMELEHKSREEQSSNSDPFDKSKLITRGFLLWDLEKEELSHQQLKEKLEVILQLKDNSIMHEIL